MFSSVLAYLLFFRLITSVGATATATVSYLLPLFGTIWAVVVAQERIGLETLAGMLVILLRRRDGDGDATFVVRVAGSRRDDDF